MDKAADILMGYIRASLANPPDFDVVNGAISRFIPRDSFEHLWADIGKLYHVLNILKVPTKTLSIDITEKEVEFTLDYKGLEILIKSYGDHLASMLKDAEEEEEGE